LDISNNAPASFPLGTTTVLWTVEDASGNTTTCEQVVTVEDNVDPMITACASDVTIGTDPNVCTATNVALGTVTVTDNCTALVDLTISNNAPATFPLGTTTVLWTVEDASGNTTTCEQIVTVEDDEDPMITTCASNVTVVTDPSVCTASNVALGAITATDNCTAMADLTISNNAPAAFPVGTTTVVWTVEDAAGNTTTCEQTVTVEDNQDPIITACATDVTVDADPSVCTASNVALGTVTATDNCTAIDDLTISNNAPATFPVGITTVVWTVVDAIGNITTCDQFITVIDNEMPVVVCGSDRSVVSDLGECSAFVDVDTPEASDNCGIGSIVNSYNNTAVASDVYPVGTHILIWFITDVNGNQSTCEQTITVTDEEAPTITCPDDITVNANTISCSADVVVPAPVADDNCGIENISNDFNGGSNASGNYPVGVTIVNWTVTDIHGNISHCEIKITVVDDTTPAIFCPESIITNTDAGVCEAFIIVEAPQTTDNCGIGSITNSLNGTNNATGVYPVGVTEIIWTVTDVNGNVNTCSMDIEVVDEELPEIICNDDISVVADLGDCAAVVVVPLPQVDDNCGVSSLVNDFSGTSNADGLYPVGITTVTWTVTDLSGNSSNCSFTVTVVDDQNPSVVCPDDILVQNDLGLCSADVTIQVPLAIDNCGIASIINDFNNTNDASGVYPVGSTIVQWTVTDLSGNVVSCSMTVVVTDTEDPQIACPANIITDNDPGKCDADVTVDAPTVSDNCGVLSVVNDYNNTANASDNYPVGTTQVIWTILDVNGNSSQCTMSITVEDVEAPSITCPENIVESIASIQPSIFVTVSQPLVSDNCAVETLVNDYTGTDDASGDYPIGTTVVTWLVTDIHGLTNTCEMSITVNSEVAPEISCPGDIMIVSAPGACEADILIEQPIVDEPAGIQSIFNDYNNTNDASGVYPVGETLVTWIVIDNNDIQNQCQMTVTVIGAPNAIDDSETTLINVPVSIMVMANDEDCDNNLDPATLIITDDPLSGKLTVDLVSGSVLYDPIEDFTGNDQFDYQICDQTGYCDIATVYITVIGNINNPPVAMDDYDTTTVGNSILIPVLENDYDPDGDDLTISICGEPLNGFVIINEDNTILYQTDEGTTATYDEFCYKICDSGAPSLCDSATVFITLLPDSTGRDIIIYNTITPDADGQNDYWHIENIEYYENVEISIFNRWGDEIITLRGYNNTSVRWAGKNKNGNDLPDGTYYYMINLNDANNSEPLTGWIYLR